MLRKQSVFRIIKSVLFCLILFLLMECISIAFTPRDNTVAAGMYNDDARGFYSEKGDSVDAFFIGDSNVFAGISPMVIWHDYGYTSYLASESGQNIAQSLFILDEILERKNPKLIVLEVDGLYSGGFQPVTNTIINRTVPLLYNHGRWKTFKWSDAFKKSCYTKHRINKGYWTNNDTVPYMGDEYMQATDQTERIPISAEPVLNYFTKKCKKLDIPLMLTHLPSAVNWNYMRHNAVKKFAEDNSLLFLDLDCERQNIGFDWHTDTRDGGNHLNNSGAYKCSQYIGKFIHENYSLPDHRGDSKYSQWDADYVGYPNNAVGKE